MTADEDLGIGRRMLDGARRLFAREVAREPHSAEVESEFELADATLEAMHEAGVPPSAENYTVWRAHLSGERPEVSKVLDEIGKNPGAFGPKMNAALYERFFGAENEAAAVYESSRKAERLLCVLQDDFEQMGESAKAGGDRLADLGDALGGASKVQEIRKLVKGVIGETAEMRMVANRLERKLVQSSAEIVDLRAELEAAQREANSDALTGVANRKSFDFYLKRCAKEAIGDDTDLSLALLDVDHFKRFNDTYGHQLGDAVLKAVARSMAQNAKRKDLVARYGGEEFAVILPGTPLAGAEAFAERLREAVAALRLDAEGGKLKVDPVTISAGVAAYKKEEPIERLVKRADRALYKAKEQGRDRVVSERDLEVVGRPKTAPAR